MKPIFKEIISGLATVFFLCFIYGLILIFH